MKYVALIRGINVGGKSIVKMVDLKSAFEKIGFKNVSTYINSGNVLFESDKKIDFTEIEKQLSKIFKFEMRVVVISIEKLDQILKNVPNEWKNKNDLRCYVAFLRGSTSAKEVLDEIDLKDGVDSIKHGEGVLYMSTKLFGLTKSGFPKLIQKTIYKEITIRNYNTVKKLEELIHAD